MMKTGTKSVDWTCPTCYSVIGHTIGNLTRPGICSDDGMGDCSCDGVWRYSTDTNEFEFVSFHKVLPSDRRAYQQDFKNWWNNGEGMVPKAPTARG